MPFAAALTEVYTQVYKPVCAANGLECWRVDEISRPGSITRDIVEGILDADLIIADLTGRNANVFYELGIAHAVSNKTIMTAQKPEDVPFDLQTYRVIFYQQTISGSRDLRADVDRAIKSLVQALDRTNNPVQDVAAKRSFFGRRTRTPLVKVVSLGTYSSQIEGYLRDHGIVYAEDLPRLDLDDMYSRPGIGRDSMARFAAELLAADVYGEETVLQDFIQRHRLAVHKAAGR